MRLALVKLALREQSAEMMTTQACWIEECSAGPYTDSMPLGSSMCHLCLFALKLFSTSLAFERM